MRELCAKLEGRRVLVTGATGFIGGRLVECLAECGHDQVRVLVRNFRRASRLARYPVEIFAGDLTDAEAVERAARDCDVIFHCAYGNEADPKGQRLVNVDGTRFVLDAALQHGVGSVVYLSTQMVYWVPQEGSLDESAPHDYIGHPYADSKIDAEKLVFSYAKEQGAPVVVLQPTVVYGPDAPVWTVNVLRQLREETVPLVDDGTGLCNAVYVDDVVRAMLLAVDRPDVAGEAFLISGDAAVTWREFYEAFAGMIEGGAEFEAASADEFRAKFKRLRRSARPRGFATMLWGLARRDESFRTHLLQCREYIWVRNALRKAIPTGGYDSIKAVIHGRKGGQSVHNGTGNGKPLDPLPDLAMSVLTSKVEVSIAKAAERLDYRPAVSFEDGMKITGEWARWANLV